MYNLIRNGPDLLPDSWTGEIFSSAGELMFRTSNGQAFVMMTAKLYNNDDKIIKAIEQLVAVENDSSILSTTSESKLPKLQVLGPRGCSKDIYKSFILVEITDIMTMDLGPSRDQLTMYINDRVDKGNCKIIFNLQYALDLMRKSDFIDEEVLLCKFDAATRDGLPSIITDDERRARSVEIYTSIIRKEHEVLEDIKRMSRDAFDMAVQMLRDDSVLAKHVNLILSTGLSTSTSTNKIKFIDDHDKAVHSAEHLVITRYETIKDGKTSRVFLREDDSKYRTHSNAWITLWMSCGNQLYLNGDKVHFSTCASGQGQDAKTASISNIDVTRHRFLELPITWHTDANHWGDSNIQRFVALSTTDLKRALNIVK